MPDFVPIARALKSCKDVEATVKSLGFRCVEELSPKMPRPGDEAGDYSSEIWVRKHADYYMAIRIDWKGHPTVPSTFAGRPAHLHFETFPLTSFGDYLSGPAEGVKRYDTNTGLESTDFKATHGRVRVIP